MKKFTAVILSVIMLMSSVVVFSAEEESREAEQILTLIKSRILSTEEYEEFTSGVSTSGDVKSYSFRWSGESGQLSVTANPQGIITSYRLYEKGTSNAGRPTINKLKSDDALEKTKALVKALNPDVADNIAVLKTEQYESLFDDGYMFSLQRTYDKIDIVGDTGYVRVNGDASRIESFNLNYTQNLKFESASAAIGKENAMESFKSELGMMLQYNIENEKATLEYVQKEPDMYISALSGKGINPTEPQYSGIMREMASDSTAASGGAENSKLSMAEIKNLEQISGLLSKEDAEKAVREIEFFAVGDKMQLSYASLYHGGVAEKYYYSMEFTSGNLSASATVDAQNGDIIRYSYYGGSYEKKAGSSADKAKEYAARLAPKYYKADDSSVYRFEKENAENYTFVRYQNDIPCPENTISISLNSDNEITYYSIKYTDAEFESAEGVLSHSQICDNLFEKCGYKLYYYPSCSSGNTSAADTALLVYDIENKNSALDAKTGEIKNIYNEFTVGNYTDIKGHYAEEEIKTLARFGIGFQEDTLSPDSLITQKDYAALITSALVGNEAVVLAKDNSVCEYYYERAADSQIIREDEKNPDGAVSREMAAVYMIRALGLDDVASLQGIYISKFSDVVNHVGHISILNAMGVVNGFGGSFNPEKELTRADAMIMLYNCLSKN